MEIPTFAQIVSVTVALFYVMAVVSALEAVHRTRTSQGAIAWAISLVSIPFIAVPLYLVFGRNRFQGYLEKRDVIERESARLISEASDSVEAHLIETAPDTPLYASLFNLARMPATGGNRVELLVDGIATFDSIQDGLASARDYILFQFYIIRDDDLGRRLGRVLMDRARAGVRIFLLYDEVGSRNFHKTRLFAQLRMTGVHVSPFNTTQGRRNRFQLNFRNHRKVVVVDGETAWIGGHNVGVEYLGPSSRARDWRDTHTRLQGPGVLGAELAFATDWVWATGTPLDIDWARKSQVMGASSVLVFPSDPASDYEEVGLMFLQTIMAARRRVWIASPYFVPDQGIISALQLAALRGVDVRVLIPDEPDGPVVGMANWAYTRAVLPAGVRIFRYQGGFMHQKVLLMDEELAGVGTANFDIRSIRLNFEITLLVHDRLFAGEVAEMLEADMQSSREVTAGEIRRKPFWFTLAMDVARLFAPVL